MREVSIINNIGLPLKLYKLNREFLLSSTVLLQGVSVYSYGDMPSECGKTGFIVDSEGNPLCPSAYRPLPASSYHINNSFTHLDTLKYLIESGLKLEDIHNNPKYYHLQDCLTTKYPYLQVFSKHCKQLQVQEYSNKEIYWLHGELVGTAEASRICRDWAYERCPKTYCRLFSPDLSSSCNPAKHACIILEDFKHERADYQQLRHLFSILSYYKICFVLAKYEPNSYYPEFDSKDLSDYCKYKCIKLSSKKEKRALQYLLAFHPGYYPSGLRRPEYPRDCRKVSFGYDSSYFEVNRSLTCLPRVTSSSSSEECYVSSAYSSSSNSEYRTERMSTSGSGDNDDVYSKPDDGQEQQECSPKLPDEHPECQPDGSLHASTRVSPSPSRWQDSQCVQHDDDTKLLAEPAVKALDEEDEDLFRDVFEEVDAREECKQHSQEHAETEVPRSEDANVASQIFLSAPKEEEEQEENEFSNKRKQQEKEESYISRQVIVLDEDTDDDAHLLWKICSHKNGKTYIDYRGPIPCKQDDYFHSDIHCYCADHTPAAYEEATLVRAGKSYELWLKAREAKAEEPKKKLVVLCKSKDKKELTDPLPPVDLQGKPKKQQSKINFEKVSKQLGNTMLVQSFNKSNQQVSNNITTIKVSTLSADGTKKYLNKLRKMEQSKKEAESKPKFTAQEKKLMKASNASITKSVSKTLKTGGSKKRRTRKIKDRGDRTDMDEERSKDSQSGDLEDFVVPDEEDLEHYNNSNSYNNSIEPEEEDGEEPGSPIVPIRRLRKKTADSQSSNSCKDYVDPLEYSQVPIDFCDKDFEFFDNTYF